MSNNTISPYRYPKDTTYSYNENISLENVIIPQDILYGIDNDIVINLNDLYNNTGEGYTLRDINTLFKSDKEMVKLNNYTNDTNTELIELSYNSIDNNLTESFFIKPVLKERSTAFTKLDMPNLNKVDLPNANSVNLSDVNIKSSSTLGNTSGTLSPSVNTTAQNLIGSPVHTLVLPNALPTPSLNIASNAPLNLLGARPPEVSGISNASAIRPPEIPGFNDVPNPSPNAIHDAPNPSPNAINDVPNPSPNAINDVPNPSPNAINTPDVKPPDAVNDVPKPSPNAINDASNPSPNAINDAPNPSPNAINDAPNPSPDAVNTPDVKSPDPPPQQIQNIYNIENISSVKEKDTALAQYKQDISPDIVKDYIIKNPELFKDILGNKDTAKAMDELDVKIGTKRTNSFLNSIATIAKTCNDNPQKCVALLAIAVAGTTAGIYIEAGKNADKCEKLKQLMEKYDVQCDSCIETSDKTKKVYDSKKYGECIDKIIKKITVAESPNAVNNKGSENMLLRNNDSTIIGLKGLVDSKCVSDCQNYIMTFNNTSVDVNCTDFNVSGIEIAKILTDLNNNGIYPGPKWESKDYGDKSGPKWTGGDNWDRQNSKCVELFNKYILNKELCWMTVKIVVEKLDPVTGIVSHDLVTPVSCEPNSVCGNFQQKYPVPKLGIPPSDDDTTWSKLLNELKKIPIAGIIIISFIIIIVIIFNSLMTEEPQRQRYTSQYRY